MSFQGLVVFLSLAGVYVVNGAVNGWRISYDILVQITSPWDHEVRSPWLALLVALAGYLAVPSVVGALVAYVVVDNNKERRERPAPTVGPNPRGGRYIPRLESLLYAGHGQAVPANFAQRFVEVHDREWGQAQQHWERVVERSLNSDAVQRYAPPKLAMRQAVSAAASILSIVAENSDRCPECLPETTESTDAMGNATESNGSDEQ